MAIIIMTPTTMIAIIFAKVSAMIVTIINLMSCLVSPIVVLSAEYMDVMTLTH